MTKLRLYILLLLFVSCPVLIYGQWDIPYSQFWMAKSYLNPAFGGKAEQIDLAGGYKMLWSGIEDAPRQLHFSAVTPVDLLGLRHHAGIMVSNVSVGNERNSILSGIYNYKFKIGASTLALGIEAGVYELNFDASIYALQQDSIHGNLDKIVVNPADKKTFNLNAGIAWQTQRFFAGIAAKHITQPRYYYVDQIGTATDVSADSTYAKIPVTYNFVAGYNIKLFDTLFEMQPMVFGQTDGTNIYRHAAILLAYDKKFSIGISWMGNDGYAVFGSLRLWDIEVGYAYDIYKSGIGKESNGSHELTFRYHFPFDLNHKKPQPHKSIRLL